MKSFFRRVSSVRKFYAAQVLVKRIAGKKIDKMRLRYSSDLHISDSKLLKMVGCSSKKEALHMFKSKFAGPLIFNNQDIFIKEIDHLLDLKVKVIENAEKCLNNRFYLFGRWVHDSFDEQEKHYKWDMDLFAGYKYKPAYYSEVRQLNKVRGVDLKLPWEFSRMHNLLFLAEAYLVTHDDSYAYKIVSIIKDWIECNPPKMGVNWNCTMDVGLRIANMVAAVSVIRSSPAFDDDFAWLFMKSCYEHGQHIMQNLENIQKSTDNHYLSNIFGLLCLSAHVKCFKVSKKWLKFSSNKLFEAIKKQIYTDGMDHEGSTSYHRLVCELFYFGTVICSRSDIKFPSYYLPIIDKMAEFIKTITKLDGRIPQIGDNDSGRVFIFSENDYLDHRYLVELVFAETRINYVPQDFYEELFWIYGARFAKQSSQQRSEQHNKQSALFPDSKLAVYKDNRLYLIVSAISNGASRMGGHTHNDKLSFELQYKGKDFFVDPGTGVYTSFPDIRNSFRSTYFHNTVAVNKLEQSAINIDAPFSIDNKLLQTSLEIGNNSNTIIIQGKHNGYFKKIGIEHLRKFLIDNNSGIITLIDSFTGIPKHLQWNFVLSPEVDITKVSNNELLLSNRDCKIRFIAPFPINITVGMYSRGYYFWKDTKIISFETNSNITGPYNSYIILS
jgi:uncharacterized heparinase superfamily protein